MRVILTIVLLWSAAACTGENPRAADAAPAGGSEPSPAPAAYESIFEAVLSGAVDRTAGGSVVFGGAKYDRYHIAMASDRPQGGPPMVVISFARDDTTSPRPGSYTLSGDDEFGGSVEIYTTPQREFDITSGELVITHARGDVITGRFTFTARESSEEMPENPVDLRARGTFKTRPAG
jgi:hypothetical protein